MGACGRVSEARRTHAWAEYVARVGAISSIRRAVCLGPWGHAVSGQQMGLWLLFPGLCLTWPLPPALHEQLVHSLHCNAPRTAIFLLVLYFVHNINLYCDPAPGFIHLCLTSGDISHWGFCFFLCLLPPRLKVKYFFFFCTFFLSHWVLRRYCRTGSDTILVIQCRKVLRQARFWWRDSKEGHLIRADLSRAEVMFAVTAVLWW